MIDRTRPVSEGDDVALSVFSRVMRKKRLARQIRLSFRDPEIQNEKARQLGYSIPLETDRVILPMPVAGGAIDILIGKIDPTRITNRSVDHRDFSVVPIVSQDAQGGDRWIRNSSAARSVRKKEQ